MNASHQRNRPSTNSLVRQPSRTRIDDQGTSRLLTSLALASLLAVVAFPPTATAAQPNRSATAAPSRSSPHPKVGRNEAAKSGAKRRVRAPARPKATSKTARRSNDNHPRVKLTYLRHLIIDPGHGGSNLGAVGYHASREKALTLEISKVLQAWLHAHSNIKVSLTRHQDVDLALRDRPRSANKLRGDALISVHCNASSKSSVHGMEVWFLTADSSMRVIHDIVRREEGVPKVGSEVARRWSAQGVVEKLRHAEAHRASQAFAIALRRGLMRARPKTRFRGIKQDAFGVLKEARMPAVVLEVGYITNPEESLTLMARRNQEAFARGILMALVELDRERARQRAGQHAAK